MHVLTLLFCGAPCIHSQASLFFLYYLQLFVSFDRIERTNHIYRKGFAKGNSKQVVYYRIIFSEYVKCGILYCHSSLTISKGLMFVFVSRESPEIKKWLKRWFSVKLFLYTHCFIDNSM